MAGVLAVAGLFVAFFFRDPERRPPAIDGVIVSPADGKVIAIGPCDQSPTGERSTKVSIFLSVFDVHINRAPAPGRIERIEYRKGKFFAAFRDDASEQNERNTFVLDSPRGKVAFSQVAGLIARRIVCWKRAEDPVALGERVGMIMFGSRVDLYLPPTIRVRVAVGDRVKGGESVIGEVK